MADEFRILVVCTGNVCRSPAAALLLRRGLGPGVVVESAGTWALIDQPLDAQMAAALAELGASDDEFRARSLEPEMVEQADLVLAMTRDHRSAVVTMLPSAMPRTFTLTEFAALLDGWEEGGAARPFYTIRVPDRLREFLAVAPRRRGTVRFDDPEQYDVPDPYRLDASVYRTATQEIARAVDTIVARLNGTDPQPARAGVGASSDRSGGEAPVQRSDRGIRRLFGHRRP